MRASSMAHLDIAGGFLLPYTLTLIGQGRQHGYLLQGMGSGSPRTPIDHVFSGCPTFGLERRASLM
jgi:hypothetical protein